MSSSNELIFALFLELLYLVSELTLIPGFPDHTLLVRLEVFAGQVLKSWLKSISE